MRGRKGRHAGLILGMTLLLGACGHHRQLDADNSSDDELNAYPSNYKADILAAMHSYLNDPTGIRDAADFTTGAKILRFGDALHGLRAIQSKKER